MTKWNARWIEGSRGRRTAERPFSMAGLSIVLRVAFISGALWSIVSWRGARTGNGSVSWEVEDRQEAACGLTTHARYAATMPERTIPSKVPAPPMLAMPVDIFEMSRR